MMVFMLFGSVIGVFGLMINGKLVLEETKNTSVGCQVNGHLNWFTPVGDVLDLSYRSLKKIPKCVESKESKSIQKLDLDNNQISDHHYYELFKVFPNLKSLMMFNNLLSVLNGNPLNIPNNLFLLDLGFNHIRVVTAAFFRAFGKLEVLKLERNKLSYLPNGVFHGLRSLKIIDLSSNILRVYSMDWFDMRTPLTFIHMGNNKVSSWKPDDFKWPKTMQQVNFSGNDLPAIPPFPRNFNDSHWMMDISSNPLYCDCRHKSHTEDMVRTSVACRLRLNCPKYTNKKSYNNGAPTTCNVDELTTKMSWLSNFVTKPTCAPPKVIGLKGKHPKIKNKYCVTCVAIGYPSPRVNMKYGSRLSSSTPFQADQKQPIHEAIIGEEAVDDVTCEAENPFGHDVQRVVSSEYYLKYSSCRSDVTNIKKVQRNKSRSLLIITAVFSSLVVILALLVCFNTCGTIQHKDSCI